MKLSKIFKYEFLNVIRNKWVFFYAFLMAALSFSLLKISGDPSKTVVTLSSIVVVLGPLFAGLFSALYWYYNERFTELLLTQPIPRASILWMRWTALSLTLSLGFGIGILIPFILMGAWTWSVLLVLAVGVFLNIAFVGFSIFFCARSLDRMKGMGLVLGLWLYLTVAHDALVLLALIALKDYPMDFPGGVLGVLNPIGLARVILLMAQDAPLLLGHVGAMARNILTGTPGILIASGLVACWIIVPLLLAHRAWLKRDF